jgi:hypothetical protein
MVATYCTGIPSLGMTTLLRTRVLWSGSALSGDGVSTFYESGTGPSGLAAAWRTFLNSQIMAFPPGVTWTFPPSGDSIEDSTGDLNGVFSSSGTIGSLTGGASGEFAKGVGMQIRWHTAGIVNHRRVVGSTFLVPLQNAIFDTDGTIDGATVTSMTSALNTFLAAVPTMRIWSPPWDPSKAPPRAKPYPPARLGTSHAVTSVQVMDRVSWLRSRRT